MGKTIMGAVVSLDGFIAADNDEVGPLFEWYSNGDVAWRFPGTDFEARSTRASADFMRSHYGDVAAVVIGRRLFDQVPVVFGSGRPFFATGALSEPLRFENPAAIVPGDFVTHLVYDVSR